MQRARRSTHLFLRVADELVPDFSVLLAGEVELVRHPRLLAVSVLTGSERGVSDAELRFLSTLPSDRWTPVSELEIEDRPIATGELRELVLAGLVVSDSDEPELRRLRERDERLAQIGWNPYASLYHSQSTWRDVDVGDGSSAGASVGVETLRRPPPPFHRLRDALETIELPVERSDDGVMRLLRDRRTTRGFDADHPPTREELSRILHYTFGCQGYRDLGDGLVLLKKTSPSGGSLHPIEAYPVVVEIDGIPSGVYHYRPDTHALELHSSLSRDAARELLVEATAGQTYLSDASVLVVMTARFGRSFWKYPHPRAYSVLYMDAAHLSQTMYLVCAELGLGAFVSAAVNAGNLEDRLGLDGFEEGVLIACGCGRPALRRSPFDVEFEPFVPRETVVDAGRVSEPRSSP